MTKLITCQHVKEIVTRLSFDKFIGELVIRLEKDFGNWNSFEKVSRPAFHSTHGVIELMPISNQNYFSFKTVNGHPINSQLGKLCVVATGQLNTVEDGYPVLISEMTLLTALRTAATCAMATKHLAQKTKSITIIGCGAQSEFLISSHLALFEVEVIYYFDIDVRAMNKFRSNLQTKANQKNVKLIPLRSASDSILDSNIIITCIAQKDHVILFESSLVVPGTHINAIGGDCPGKTELDPNILEMAKIVVEYLPQTQVEGEIQNYTGEVNNLDITELWEVVKNQKEVRSSDQDITLFDAVGFALEDYTVLTYIHEVSDQLGIFDTVEIVPYNVGDPKNLFGFLIDH
jgi:ornithine cyclodeaminase